MGEFACKARTLPYSIILLTVILAVTANEYRKSIVLT